MPNAWLSPLIDSLAYALYVSLTFEYANIDNLTLSVAGIGNVDMVVLLGFQTESRKIWQWSSLCS